MIEFCQISAKSAPDNVLPASPDMNSSINHYPNGPWQFDTAVTEVFDDMLSRSIPQYENMRDLVFDIGQRFVRPQLNILDLGCSKGESLVRFIDKFGADNYYTGIEISKPMLEVAKTRFKTHPCSDRINIHDLDLRHTYPDSQNILTLSILTLQFIPVERRLTILKLAYQHTQPGGALILVEKIRGSSKQLDQLMIDRYHEFKLSQGYSKKAIEQKKRSLEGILIPLSATENLQMLHQAGFAEVDCFWRWMNFSGWIAVKGNPDHL